MDHDTQKNMEPHNDPSLHDSASFDSLTEQEKDQNLVATSDIEALYRVEEDPGKPSLQVPVYLFANTSIEEVRAKDGTVGTEIQQEPPANSDLLEHIKSQMLESMPAQTDDDSSVGSGMLVDEDVDMPEFLQSIERTVDKNVGSPPRQIIAIIQETDDEDELEDEEDVPEDVLRKFVVGGIQTSTASLQSGGREGNTITRVIGKDVPFCVQENQTGDDAEDSHNQVIIFSSAESMPVDSNLVTESATMQDIGRFHAQRDRKSESVIRVADQGSSSEGPNGIPLDMAFEVVGELKTADGSVLLREITTQTCPMRKARSHKKRKLKDADSGSPSKMPAFGRSDVGQEVVISQAGFTRSYDMQLKKYKCSKCTLRFHSEDRRNIHMRCHQDASKNYACFYCGHQESQWMKMYHHLFKHGVEKPHKCEKCSFTCVNRSDLTAHMAVHSTTKDWHCNKCGRPFKHRRNMVVHLRLCPGLDESGKLARRPEDEEKFICSECQKVLSTKKNLEKHMEIHLDVKPFVCEHCGHATRLKESLIMHKRLHTGEKPYKCKMCDYATPDKSSLRRHNRIHTNDKPYKCQYCNYKCIQKHCLDTHVRRKHTGEQFVCGLCHYATHDRYGLNQHFKRHQNPDGTVDGMMAEVVTSTPETDTCARTMITLPSGAVLTSTVIDGGKTTLIADAAAEKTISTEETSNQPFVRIDTHADDNASNQEEPQVESANATEDKVEDPNVESEETTVQLSHLEADLLQRIQQPGDEVFLQPSGEIVIRRQDGHLLVIQQQQQEMEEENAEEYLASVDQGDTSGGPERADESGPSLESSESAYGGEKEEKDQNHTSISEVGHDENHSLHS